MKQKINGPMAIAALVIVCGGLMAYLYKTFLYEKQISPEDTLKAMSAHGKH